MNNISVLHEKLKHKNIESVWVRWIPVGSKRQYLKLKKFKNYIAKNDIVPYLVEDKSDRIWYYYVIDNLNGLR